MSRISCTAINRPMVAHEDPDVPLHLQEGIAAIPQFLSALYRFTRPHTMLGTFISVISVSALAVVSCLASYNCIAAWRCALSDLAIFLMAMQSVTALLDPQHWRQDVLMFACRDRRAGQCRQS